MISSIRDFLEPAQSLGLYHPSDLGANLLDFRILCQSKWTTRVWGQSPLGLTHKPSATTFSYFPERNVSITAPECLIFRVRLACSDAKETGEKGLVLLRQMVKSEKIHSLKSACVSPMLGDSLFAQAIYPSRGTFARFAIFSAATIGYDCLQLVVRIPLN